MFYEVKVVCRYCSHEFWAATVEADAQHVLNGLLEVQCPENANFIQFRISDGRKPKWDKAWIFHATEWRPVERLTTGYPTARVVGE